MPALVKALSDGDGEVRVASARALGLLGGGSRAAFAALVTASQDQGSTALRTEAIKALGAMGAQAADALPELIKAAKDPDVVVVSQAAIEAIGKMGPAAYPAVGTLAAILQNGQPPHRKLAAQALGGVGSAAVPELIAALRSEQDSDVRSAVATSLAQIGPSAVPALVEVLGEGAANPAGGAKAALKAMGVVAVPGLIVAYRTADTTLRTDILKVFSDVGPYAFAGFELALQDKNEQIRDQAVLYATEIYSDTTNIQNGAGLAVKEAVPFLASEVVAGDQNAPTNAKCGKDGDQVARTEAMCVLTVIGSDAVDAVPALAGALQDTDQASTRQSRQSPRSHRPAGGGCCAGPW